MADWGLQAVVRGSGSCETDTSVYNNIVDFDERSCFAAPFSGIGDEFSHIFPDFFENNTSFDGFEGLFKPFCPLVLNPFSPQTMASSSISLPTDQIKDHPEKIQQKIQNTSATKCKPSKKNQQSRVVKQVSADGVSSDVWAWRKYGQKPIKGSPYPRSYYRCSSSKGCSARKQVERSHSDPSIFTITYTSDHNHAHPTRRNSLAGSTRNKFPKLKNVDKYSNSPTFIGENMLSPASALMTSNDEEVEQIIRVKIEEEEQVMEEGESGEVLLPSFFSSDDLFPSIEELLFG